MRPGAIPVDPAILADFDPRGLPAGIDRSPQQTAAVWALVVFLVLGLEKELVGVGRISGAVLADLHLHRLHAVRAEEALSAAVPGHGRIAHIAVPCLFLGKYRKNALVPLLVQLIQAVQVCDAAYHHAVGVGKGFPNLPHPFPGNMRGRHHQPKGFFSSVSVLRGPQAMQRADCGRADLALAAPAFRDNDGGAVPFQLAFDRFCHGELGVVQRVARPLQDAVVDGQHLL